MPTSSIRAGSHFGLPLGRTRQFPGLLGVRRTSRSLKRTPNDLETAHNPPGTKIPRHLSPQRLRREFAAMTGTDLRLITIITCAACSVAVKYSAIGVRG
jgi:hypothetical protein